MISTAWWGPTKCTRYAFLMSWENSRKLKFRNCPQSILVDTIMSNFLIHLFYSSNEVGNRMLKFTLSLTIHFDITSPWKWLLSPLLLGSWDRSGPRSLWSKRSRSRSSQKPRLVPSRHRVVNQGKIFWFRETDISTCFVGRVYRLTQQENEMVFTQRLLSALEMLIDHIICSWAEIQRQGQFI